MKNLLWCLPPLLWMQSAILTGFSAEKPNVPELSPQKEEQARRVLETLGGGEGRIGDWNLNLSRHWAGTMRVVSMSRLYQEDKIGTREELVRFNQFSARAFPAMDPASCPLLLATAKHSITRTAVYRSELPSAEDLKDQGKLLEIMKSFGAQHGWTDGWGSTQEMHTTEGWTWFTPVKGGKIRLLDVFVHVLQKTGRPKQVEEWLIKEGIFSSLDPADKSFPAEDEKEAKEEAEVDAKDSRLPEPLRSYVKARHKPGDSELKACFAVVRKFRSAPDGLLLKQLVARLDEGTCEMSGMLGMLFRDTSFEKHLGKWDRKKRHLARGLLLDALPLANSRESLESAVELALRETGVHTLNLDVAEVRTNLTSRYTKDDAEGSYDEFTVRGGVEEAGKVIQNEIRRRWTKEK